MHWRLLLFIPFLTLPVLSTCQPGQVASIFDRVHTLGTETMVLLDRSWHFRGHRLLMPGALSDQKEEDPPADNPDSSAPGKGNSSYVQISQQLNDEQPCATFSQNFTVNSEVVPALFVRSAFSAYRLYDNGQLLASRGQLSCRPGQTRGGWGPTAVSLKKAGQHQLVLQVSQTEFHFGRFRVKVILGPEDRLRSAVQRQLFTESTILGAILLMGFFSMVFQLNRREDRTFLYFTLLCAASAFFVLINGWGLIALVVPSFQVHYIGPANAVNVYLLVVLFVLFIESTMARLPHFFRLLVWSTSLGAALATFILPGSISREIFAWFRIALAAYIIVTVFILARKKQRSTLFTLNLYCGVFLAMDFFTSLYSYSQPIIYGWRFTGLVAFTTINAGWLARMLGHSLIEITRQESELREQTVLIQKNTVELELANKQKEILLAEVYHRVKNNLQIILSLIWLPRNLHPEAKPALKDLESRIRTIARIHEDLFSGDTVSLEEYIKNLVNNILSSTTEKEIKTTVEVDDIELGVNQAMACGLIINELVTNSLKYAFTDQPDKEIGISLTRQGNKARLVVADNGSGTGADNRQGGSKLGLRLVEDLAAAYFKVTGTFNIENGARYELVFPLKR